MCPLFNPVLFEEGQRLLSLISLTDKINLPVYRTLQSKI